VRFHHQRVVMHRDPRALDGLLGATSEQLAQMMASLPILEIGLLAARGHRSPRPRPFQPEPPRHSVSHLVLCRQQIGRLRLDLERRVYGGLGGGPVEEDDGSKARLSAVHAFDRPFDDHIRRVPPPHRPDRLIWLPDRRYPRADLDAFESGQRSTDGVGETIREAGVLPVERQNDH